MVDFLNGNLCGASKELNDVLSKLADAKSEIVNKIDAAASEAAAKFAEEQNELNSLTAKLQTVVIPKIPKLNLQAEVSSLLSQAPGSVAYAVAAAKVALEFKDDIASKGLTLDTLVSASAAASDLICKVVPNLEKEAGSEEPAKELPPATKQADLPAAVEAASKVWQNPNIESKTKELIDKVAAFATTDKPPTEDTSKFKLVPSSIVKTISTGGGAPPAPVAVEPTTAAERKNYVPEDKAAGFSYKKTKMTEKFSVGGEFYPKVKGSGTIVQLPLKHKPTGSFFNIGIFPGENYHKEYINERYFGMMGLTEPSSDANGQFTYPHWKGRHLAWIILHPTATELSHEWSITGSALNIELPCPLSDHPGNIDSGGYHAYSDPDHFAAMGYEKFMKPGRRRLEVPSKKLRDSFFKKKLKGVAVFCRYEYLEQYDPDYEPA